MSRPQQREFTSGDARGWIARPTAEDDKYSRGVLGFVTGSALYPGAAVLGVEAALHTGVGMVRYLGPERSTSLVLDRRPEAVTIDGRVQTWVIGSGQDATQRDDATRALLDRVLAQDVPVVIDSGALDLAERATGPAVITPHAGELAGLLSVERAEVVAEPVRSAMRVATDLNVTVLLKGHTSHVATPDGAVLNVAAPTTWLATAGSGDALAGIVGALAATHASAISDDHSVLASLVATACVIHGLAGEHASGGGPFTVLALCAELPTVVASLLDS